MTPRVVFLGTPSFAVPSLGALAALDEREEITLAGIVTQPDRAGDRGRIVPSPVKRRAQELGLTLLQPILLDGEGLEPILVQGMPIHIRVNLDAERALLVNRAIGFLQRAVDLFEIERSDEASRLRLAS